MKGSNAAWVRFPSAYLRTRISARPSHVRSSSASKESDSISRSVRFYSQFCRFTAARDFKSRNWLSHVTGDKINQQKKLESLLSASFMTDSLQIEMGDKTMNCASDSASAKQKHLVEDATADANHMKTDAGLHVHDKGDNAGGVSVPVGGKSDDQMTKFADTRSAKSHDRNVREQIICNRPWEMTKKGKKFYSSYDDLGHTVYEFSIVSYNVLAQNLLTENAHLYENCDQRFLDWDFRKNLLLAELRKYHPDVMCFQEVNEDHYQDFFLPQLESLGYGGAYKKRTGVRKDGCATFYRRDKFDCHMVYPVEYLVPEVALLDRDNVALVLLLQPKHCSRYINTALCVANTHLLFDPKRGDIKLAQLMILFSVIDKLVFKESRSPSNLVYHPVVLCGDFNMEPFSKLYNFVRSGSLVCDGSIIRRLSGQESEYSRGPIKCLDAEFLSKAAGITDQCQFMDVAMERLEKQLEMMCLAAAGGLSSEFSKEIVDKLQTVPNEFISQGLGKITHRLGLRSVYELVNGSQNMNADDVEVTTYHGSACCTVDYIFYSSAGKREKKAQSGVMPSGGSHLELMSCLKLLTTSEMEKVGELPNELNASDHTMLMAKFSFKL